MTETGTSENQERTLQAREIEKKWQQRWEADGLYHTDLSANRKYYFLTMLPYTSGDLHVGHWYPMAPSDAAARYKRMRGYERVLPDRVRRVRAAGGERGDQAGDPPAQVDLRQHRPHARPAEDDGRDVRLEQRERSRPTRSTTGGTSGSS